MKTSKIFFEILEKFRNCSIRVKMTFTKIWFYTWFSAVFYLCEFCEKIETQKLYNFWTVDRIEVIFFWNRLIFQEKFDSLRKNGVIWTETFRGIFLWSYIIFSRKYLTFKLRNSNFLWQNTYSLKILAILKNSASTRKWLSSYRQKYAMLDNRS